MPARCTSCGEDALADSAKFCVVCGAALPAFVPPAVTVEPAPPPPPPEPEPDRATRSGGRSVPDPGAKRPPEGRAEPPAPRPRPPRPVPLPDAEPFRESPLVSVPVVLFGVAGLLLLLVILLLVG